MNEVHQVDEQMPQTPRDTPATCPHQDHARGAKGRLLRIVVRYGGAVLAVAAALGLRWLLQDYFGTALAIITFFPSVAVVAMFAGGGPGVLATVLSAAVIKLFVGFRPGNTGDVMATGFFILSGLIVSATAEMLRRARRREVIVLAKEVAKRTSHLEQSNSRLQQEMKNRNRAEEALRKINDRYKLVLTGAEAGIWDWDVPAHKVVFSHRWKAMRGFAENEITDAEDEWSRGIHPDDTPRVMAAVQAHFDGKTAIFAEEYRVCRKDGSWIWIADRGLARRDADGRVVRMAGSETDITARQEAEAALRESEERLRLAYQAAKIGAFEWNVQTGVNVWTPELEAMYGLAPGEFGRTQTAWEQLIHPEDRAAAVGLVDLAFETGEPVGGEWRVVWPDGSVHWIHGRFQVIKDAAGSPLRLTGVNLDITERKQAEEALRVLNESLERQVAERTKAVVAREMWLKAILDAASDAIITIDNRGVISSVNPATERVFGYARDELIGQNVKVLMPFPYRHHDGYLQRYLSTREAHIIGCNRELVARRRDGSTFPVELSVSEINHLGFAGIIRDISKRKELERHVLEIADDEQRRIGQELHDGTGQELTGLALFAGTLLEILNSAAPREIEGHALRLLEEADFLRLQQAAGRLSRGLTEANRHVHALSHGIMPVQIDAEGLRSALEELAVSMDAQDDIICRFECSGQVVVPNNTTATHLYRIAQEALNNALRHGRADQIRISLSQKHHQITLEVSDNGIGFDPAAKNRVGPAGEGMGLRIMDYRASMIGGVLHIERNEQGGMLVKCTVLGVVSGD